MITIKEFASCVNTDVPVFRKTDLCVHFLYSDIIWENNLRPKNLNCRQSYLATVGYSRVGSMSTAAWKLDAVVDPEPEQPEEEIRLLGEQPLQVTTRI